MGGFERDGVQWVYMKDQNFPASATSRAQAFLPPRISHTVVPALRRTQSPAGASLLYEGKLLAGSVKHGLGNGKEHDPTSRSNRHFLPAFSCRIGR
jgi:hypothetical protein